MTVPSVSPHARTGLSATSDKPLDSTTDPNATLFAALVEYLTETRDRDEVRRAIAQWTHDVERAGRQPEDVLIQFKARLLDAAPSLLNPREEQLLDKRELISMSIEEFIHR